MSDDTYTGGSELSQIEKNQRKGRRHENQARQILKRNYGKASRVTDTARATGTTDLFNCADLIACKWGWPVKLVQVKSNRLPGDYEYGWAPAFTDNEHVEFEFWTRFDREGWVIHRYEPTRIWEGEFVEAVEMGTCDIDEAASIYGEYLENRGLSDTDTDQS